MLKPSAASPHLLRHTGRAVVFENIEHYNQRIADPNLSVDASSVLVLKNCGVSTSGDVEQFVEIDGVRYSHIIDPSTGLGLTNRAMATVIAPDGLTSDALDTPICILGAERGLKMASGQTGVHAWTSWFEGKRRKKAWTEQFPDFVVDAED